MKDEKVFITGVSGFLGYNLAVKCIEKGYTVGGLVRQHPQHNQAIENLRGKIYLYEGDLTDPTRLGTILRDFNPDYICHLGALTRVSYSFGHEQETFNVNAGGTVNMVTQTQRYCSNLKKFIYASSMEAYGHQPHYHKYKIPFDENTVLGVGSPYAVWKIMGDYFVRQQHYANKFPGVVLRQTNCYGRKFDDYFVVEAFITSMLKNKDVVNFGNPEPIRNFLYVDDLINLYLTLFEAKDEKVVGQAFTTGPPNGISISKLADMIASKLDWNGHINWYTRELRSGEIFYLNSSNKYVTDLTGWKPKVSLDEGLDKTIKFWRNEIK